MEKKRIMQSIVLTLLLWIGMILAGIFKDKIFIIGFIFYSIQILASLVLIFLFAYILITWRDKK